MCNRRIALQLDEIEAAHDFVLLLADDARRRGRTCCSRHSDEMLLLADAAQPPALHATEPQCLMQRPGRTEAAEILVLLHPARRALPERHARLAGAAAGHRPPAPAARARSRHGAPGALQSRTAVGLVLAGGGARGFAHLGVLPALQERGIEIDFVGGTSIGAVMASLVASTSRWRDDDGDRPRPLASTRRATSI